MLHQPRHGTDRTVKHKLRYLVVFQHLNMQSLRINLHELSHIIKST
jgi:hypothetical protein